MVCIEQLHDEAKTARVESQPDFETKSRRMCGMPGITGKALVVHLRRCAWRAIYNGTLVASPGPLRRQRQRAEISRGGRLRSSEMRREELASRGRNDDHRCIQLVQCRSLFSF